MDDFSDLAGAALVVGGVAGSDGPSYELLAQRGSKRRLTWRSNAEAAERLCDEVPSYGVRVSSHQLETTDASACSAVVDAMVERYGALHTLVAAAGPHVPMTHLSNVDPASLSEQLSADAGAFFNVVQPALPALRSSTGSVVAVTTPPPPASRCVTVCLRRPRPRSRRWRGRWRSRRAGTASAPTASGPACSPTGWPKG